ncbi:hypothetical protein BJV77DRAFT_583704 [Russula vinacea]|nr:hypothetical protein BJV77DRAFT_583704 [Russula vinacea]
MGREIDMLRHELESIRSSVPPFGSGGPHPGMYAPGPASVVPYPHPPLVGMVCHHTSLHKFRTIKRHLRRNQIRARVLRRTPSTLPRHRKAEVAVERPAKREKHRRPSSSI